MAFPTTSVLDAFNRADGDPGSAWSAAYGANGKPAIETNQLKNTTGTAANSGMYWNTREFTDCEVYLTIVVLPSPVTEDVWMTARTKNLARTGPPPDSSSWSGYQVLVSQNLDAAYVRKYDGTSATVIISASTPAAVAAGDKAGMKLVGTSIELWYKSGASAWGMLGSTSDSTYSGSGYIGLEFDEATSRYDDFGGGSLDAVLRSQYLDYDYSR